MHETGDKLNLSAGDRLDYSTRSAATQGRCSLRMASVDIWKWPQSFKSEVHHKPEPLQVAASRSSATFWRTAMIRAEVQLAVRLASRRRR